MIEITTNQSRRSVLKAGAIAGGIGLTGLVGSAAAKGPVNGGMAMITSAVLSDYGEGDPFQIVAEVDNANWNPTLIDTSCGGGDGAIAFVPYHMEAPGKEDRWIFFPQDKDVKLGDNWHVFHNVEEACSDVGDGRTWAKVRVKPDRGRP